jgi:hypothetical protein
VVVVVILHVVVHVVVLVVVVLVLVSSVFTVGVLAILRRIALS